jgi:hypothetical protein
MILRRMAAALVLSVPMMIAAASGANAGVPLNTTGSVDDDVFVANCGAFDVRDHLRLESRGKIFLDRAGNPARIVQQVSGSDTFYNSVSGKSVTGTINSGEIVNLIDGTVTQSGSVGRITVPGLGVVFFDVGKFIIDFDSGLVFLAGHHHDFFEGNFAPLCALLS